MIRILLLTGTPLVSQAGCEKSEPSTAPEPSEDATDRLTRSLLVELHRGDRDAVLALTSQTLAADLDERDVAVIARTLTWLGGVEALERLGEEPVVSGHRRRYRVEFGGGEVELSVTVVGGKVEGFELAEGQWTTLVDRAAEAAAGSLRVAEFRYLDDKGKPLAQPLDPASIKYELALEGLDAQLREHHVAIGKAVFDAAGEQVYRQPEDDDIRFPQSEAGSSGGRITGSVAVPGPGRYELELEIRDLIGRQWMTHRESFAIE